MPGLRPLRRRLSRKLYRRNTKKAPGGNSHSPATIRSAGNGGIFTTIPSFQRIEEQVAISNQSIALPKPISARRVRLSHMHAASLFPAVSTSPGYTRSRFSQTSRGATVVGGAPVTTTGTGTTGTGTGTGTGTTGTGTTGTGTTGTGTSGGSGTGVGGTSNTGILNNFTFPASLSYEVDLWHRIRNTVAANAFQAQASAADIATAILSTQSELAQDYFEIRALDVQRQILRETIANYRQTLELTNCSVPGRNRLGRGYLASADAT